MSLCSARLATFINLYRPRRMRLIVTPTEAMTGNAGDEILHSCVWGIQKKGSLLTIKQPVQWKV